MAAVSTIAVIMVRIPGANLLLDQQSRDTGSAAALTQFSGTIMGATGIQIVSASSHDLIWSYGMLMIAIGTACAVLWFLVQHQPFVADKIPQPS